MQRHTYSMGACFVHRGHDIIQVELCRFLAQLPAAGPCSFELLHNRVRAETAWLLALRKVQEGLHELGRYVSRRTEGVHALCGP